jgi:ATP-dependent Clp protease ATP-binding subunit ClpX
MKEIKYLLESNNKMNKSDTLNSCSFCGKHKDTVAKLIVGVDVAICNECVDLCESLLKEEPASKDDSKSSLDPRTIKEHLDQYVIGQDRAKTVLSVAIANHYKRINNKNRDTEIEKANILMFGPTGSGKTLLARTVAKYLDVPFVIADATSLTEAGYVGDDVETVISRLYAASGNDVEKTQRGIVFLDEIDKISRRSESASITRDVSGEGVQQALLKLVEGTKCRIQPTGGRKHPGNEMVEIDTTDILFIGGGAFVGLDNLVKNRIKGTSIGFNAEVKNDSKGDLDHVTPDDIVKFGMIPEFVGRFPSWVALRELSLEDLISILNTVKNCYVEQYKWLFEQDQVGLDFEKDALTCIAENTIKNKTGARGLHSELERVLLPHMFNLKRYNMQGINHLLIDKTLVNTPRELEDNHAQIARKIGNSH